MTIFAEVRTAMVWRFVGDVHSVTYGVFVIGSAESINELIASDNVDEQLRPGEMILRG